MTDADHAEHWALDDDELEALMSGATPEDLGRVGNPVAEFFIDARHARGVQRPWPDESLRQLFAGEGDPLSVGPVTVAPRPGTPPHPAPVAGRPTGEGIAPGWFADERPLPPRRPGPEPVAAEHRPDPYRMAPASAPVFGSGALGGLDATRVDNAEDRQRRGSLLSDHTAVDNHYRPPRRAVYDPSPVEFLTQVLRPTGPKVLMGLATVALLLTAGQLLGVLSLPIFGDTGVENQAVGETELAVPNAGIARPDPAGDADRTGQPAAPANGASSLVTVPLPTSDPTAATATTVQSATTAATRAENTTTPTIAQSTSSSIEDTTSSLDASSTTVEDPDATSSTPSSNVTTPGSETTVESTPTTEATTTTVSGATATVVLGQTNLPGTKPAGTWSAPAEAGCEVRVVPVGGPDRLTAAADGTITFGVAATDTFIVGPGCPTTFTVG